MQLYLRTMSIIIIYVYVQAAIYTRGGGGVQTSSRIEEWIFFYASHSDGSHRDSRNYIIIIIIVGNEDPVLEYGKL